MSRRDHAARNLEQWDLEAAAQTFLEAPAHEAARAVERVAGQGVTLDVARRQLLTVSELLEVRPGFEPARKHPRRRNGRVLEDLRRELAMMRDAQADAAAGWKLLADKLARVIEATDRHANILQGIVAERELAEAADLAGLADARAAVGLGDRPGRRLPTAADLEAAGLGDGRTFTILPGSGAPPALEVDPNDPEQYPPELRARAGELAEAEARAVASSEAALSEARAAGLVFVDVAGGRHATRGPAADVNRIVASRYGGDVDAYRADLEAGHPRAFPGPQLEAPTGQNGDTVSHGGGHE